MRSQLEHILYQSFIAPRQTYTLIDLGCPVIEKYGKRIDFYLDNIEGSYQCSYYQPKIASKQCVVYLHSMGGSRLESCGHARQLLQKGIAFASLDFCGSGMSQGNQNSLGVHSKHEVIGLLAYLQQKFQIQKFILWGRSMGAAIALKVIQLLQQKSFNSKSTKKRLQLMNKSSLNKITGIILDSPFCSLEQIILQMSEQKMNFIPKLLIKAVIRLMKNTIQKVTKCKLIDYELLPVIKNIQIPILIVASKEDSMINWDHSEKLYNQCQNKNKQLIFVNGLHADPRNFETMTKLLTFIQECNKQNKHCLFSLQKRDNKIHRYKSLSIKNSIINQKIHTQTSVSKEIGNNTINELKQDAINSTAKELSTRHSIYIRHSISPILTKRHEKVENLNLQRQNTISVKQKPQLYLKKFIKTSAFLKKQHISTLVYQKQSIEQCKTFLC